MKKMIRFIAMVFAIYFIPKNASAQSAANPVKYFKTTTVSNVDSFIRNHMNVNHIPGVAACIVKNGKIYWEGYYGLANIPLQDSVRENTIFMLASISKTITASALLQLWEQKRFSLDDSINAYLPFPVRNPLFPAIPITFRHLLCHVSSISDTYSQMTWSMGDSPIALGTYLQEYLTPGGKYYSSTNYSAKQPGGLYKYCNIGAALAGYLVEAITKIPFDQYCRDSIFQPLGMTNTAWFLKDLNSLQIARPYTWSGSYLDHGLYGYPDYPDGQLRTTLRSLARFLAAHIGYGAIDGVRILDSATVALIRTIQYPTLNKYGGLIWQQFDVLGKKRWGHVGSDYGVSTIMSIDTIQQNGVIVLTNYSPSSSAPIAAMLLDMIESPTVDVKEHNADEMYPAYTELLQNYPNPFNPTTAISYQLSANSFTTLKIYDAIGREVSTLVNEVKDAGYYSAQFDGTKISSGIYFYKLTSGNYVGVKKLVLLK